MPQVSRSRKRSVNGNKQGANIPGDSAPRQANKALISNHQSILDITDTFLNPLGRFSSIDRI